MNWTRRWITLALAAGLTTWFAALAAPAASAAPPAVATTITTDFTSSFTAVNPCTAGTGTVAVAGQDVLHVTDFGGGPLLATGAPVHARGNQPDRSRRC